MTRSEIGRVASGARRGEDLVAKSAQKVTLSPSQDIPFDKLVVSQSNVRRIKAGISVEERTKDIARRGLLQSLTVRPVLADDGSETGKYEIPAGGRRFQALPLLVKQRRLTKTTPIPCIVRDANSTILAEDDSLAENMQRAALHPLDQFRAFVALREKGQGDEEIAAAFFVTPQVVKQRLKLTSVAPALLEVYAEDEMTLEKLTAFTVKGEGTAQLLDHLKKGEMASEAERLLKGSGWLPEVLCRHDREALDGAEGQGAHELVSDAEKAEDVDLPAFLTADLQGDDASMMAAE